LYRALVPTGQFYGTGAASAWEQNRFAILAESCRVQAVATAPLEQFDQKDR
jgi:hypothetical protein